MLSAQNDYCFDKLQFVILHICKKKYVIIVNKSHTTRYEWVIFNFVLLNSILENNVSKIKYCDSNLYLELFYIDDIDFTNHNKTSDLM